MMIFNDCLVPVVADVLNYATVAPSRSWQSDSSQVPALLDPSDAEHKASTNPQPR